MVEHGTTAELPRKGLCRVDGCGRPRIKGAFMCAVHIGDKRRCEGLVRTLDPNTGEILTERQCKRSAMPGLTTCRQHGAVGPKSLAASARTTALTAMQRFVQPYEGDLSPVVAFENEYRRTYGRILWLEEQLGAIKDERDLIWGLTKTETITASEFSGTNKTYEARVHVFEDMMRWERKHLVELTKLWLKAGLEERKLSMVRDNIAYTQTRVYDVVRELGLDPDDPDTLAKIVRAFERADH